MVCDFWHVLGPMVWSIFWEPEPPLFSRTEGVSHVLTLLTFWDLGGRLAFLGLHYGCLWLWFYVSLFTTLGPNHGILWSWRALCQCRLTQGNLTLTFFSTNLSLFLSSQNFSEVLMPWQRLGLECTLQCWCKITALGSWEVDFMEHNWP